MKMEHIIYKFRTHLLSIYKRKREKRYRNLFVSTSPETVRIRANGVVFNTVPANKSIFIGNSVIIDGILQSVDGVGKINIGDYSYIGENTRIWSYLSIFIGKNVLISHNCNIIDSDCHPIDYIERREDYNYLLKYGKSNHYRTVVCEPITIEDDVWIGANVCIMKGVTIGARSIVAAGSVVTHSVPQDVIVAGNPAKVVKCQLPEKLNLIHRF